MFDDNKIDEMMKSILESGQEEVPAHIWEGVSAGLDKAARRKAVVIWFRRAAIGAASAAAAITLGILFSNPSEENITSSATGILASAEDIAVVETPQQQEILAAQALTSQALTAAEDPAPTHLAPTTAAQAIRVMEAMEAMASGLPIIASRIRGNSDLVSAEGGTLVDPCDVSGFKDAINELLSDEDKRMSMCAYNKGEAQKYTAKVVEERLAELYL